MCAFEGLDVIRKRVVRGTGRLQPRTRNVVVSRAMLRGGGGGWMITSGAGGQQAWRPPPAAIQRTEGVFTAEETLDLGRRSHGFPKKSETQGRQK